MRIDIDDDSLSACVSCGLCLPHCPTYRVTGEESASPRGRIAAMREARLSATGAPPQFAEFMDLCVGCRGCEPACPASVPFGRMMDAARASLVREGLLVPRWQRMAYAVLGRHRVLLALSSAGALLQRAGLLPRRLGLPRLPLRRRRLRGAGRRALDRGPRAWLFTGCVMDAWMRDVHQAAIDTVERTGTRLRLPSRARAACCGALHLHAGLEGRAKQLARRVVSAFPGDEEVLVDSAGCCAAMAAYGELLGTEEAARFASRVRDLNAWLAERIELLPRPAGGSRTTVAVQDPCHLRHVLGAHQAVRRLLAPYATIAELDDDGLCCGAGGAYSALHPDMAGRIRGLKLDSIARTGATLVASANPGCIAHLRAAGVAAVHPVEIVVGTAKGESHVERGTRVYERAR